MFKKINIALFSLFICLLGCKTKKESVAVKPETTQNPSLKNSFKDDFLIGAALNTNQIKELDTSAVALLKKEFNSITPENDMKWEQIHPAIDSFYFDIADKYLASISLMPILSHWLITYFTHQLIGHDFVIHRFWLRLFYK